MLSAECQMAVTRYGTLTRNGAGAVYSHEITAKPHPKESCRLAASIRPIPRKEMDGPSHPLTVACGHHTCKRTLPHVYAGAHARSVDELYDILQFTYPASIGRIRKGVELDQSLHAHLEKLCPADVLDIEPEHQFAELLRKLSSYMDESSGAVR